MPFSIYKAGVLIKVYNRICRFKYIRLVLSLRSNRICRFKYIRLVVFKGIVDRKIENILLFTLEKNGLNKKDVFFPGIEDSVIIFSLRCKENELHRKYKVLGRATVGGKF